MQSLLIITLCLLINTILTSPTKKHPEPCFHCEDGSKCIPKTRVCDGKSDCKDGSDENVDCRKLVPDCAPPAFKCQYGACIKGSARCDGAFDCADGSDERNCFDIEEEPKNVTKCRPSVRELCDGYQHCEDGSDETAELCSRLPACPHMSYRCAYGACVHGQARCNGLTDCVDGSDEADCITTENLCTTPHEIPRNARVQILPHDNRLWLTYKCKPQFALVKESIHMCLHGRWHPAPLRKNVHLCESLRSA